MEISEGYNDNAQGVTADTLSRADAVKYTEASVRQGLDANGIQLVRDTVSKYGGFGEGMAVSMAPDSTLVDYAVESSVDDINEVLREAREDNFAKLSPEQQEMSRAGLNSSIGDAIPQQQEVVHAPTPEAVLGQ